MLKTNQKTGFNFDKHLEHSWHVMLNAKWFTHAQRYLFVMNLFHIGILKTGYLVHKDTCNISSFNVGYFLYIRLLFVKLPPAKY